MDQVTQKNAAMVEESTAASHSLSQETSLLSDIIRQFRVGDASVDDSMRHELQKAAPHAFRPTGRADQGRASQAPRPVAKAAVNGGKADANWEEF